MIVPKLGCEWSPTRAGARGAATLALAWAWLVACATATAPPLEASTPAPPRVALEEQQTAPVPSPAPAPPVSASAGPPPTTAASAAPTTGPLCALVAAENEAAFAALRQLPDPTAGTWDRAAFTADRACLEDATGAWALRLASYSDDVEPIEDWHLVRLQRGGDRQEIPLGRGPLLDCDPLQGFDYDADGVAEVLVRCHASEPRDGRLEAFTSSLWTRRGNIERFGATEDLRILRLDDVDGDGRPDAVYRYFETIDFVCNDNHAWGLVSPELLAHSIEDGSFARADEAALAYARRRCPTPLPGVIFPPGETDEAPAERIACALLWGRSVADVTRQLARDCRAHPRPEQAGVILPCHPCFDSSYRAEYLTRPPVTLSAGASPR